MKIQVLGSGCPTCKKFHAVILKAAEELKLKTEVQYVTGAEGLTKIMDLGAMSSPVLTIDDQIVMTGYSGDVEKIKTLISNSSQKKQ